MEKYNKWMQWFWLSVALVSGAYAIITYATAGDEPVEILIYIMPLLAFFLFLMRLWHRKRLDKIKKSEGK